MIVAYYVRIAIVSYLLSHGSIIIQSNNYIVLSYNITKFIVVECILY